MSESVAKIITIIIFILTYSGLLIFSKKRSYIALTSAIILIILNITPLNSVLSVINFDLIIMLLSIMGIVGLFTASNMPSVIGDKIISKTSNYKWAIILLAVFSGITSAFIDNVATVLIIAPIAINMAKKTDTSPVVPIIIISVMSNLQGAATLVGDATSILLADQASLTFFDYFIFKGKMGLFFIIQISMLLTIIFLLFVLRRYNQRLKISGNERVKFIFPTILLISTIVLLICASFIKINFALLNASICLSLFIIGLICYYLRERKIKPVLEVFKQIDFNTLLLIASLFIIIRAIQNVGVIEDISSLFVSLSSNPFVIYTAIVFASILLSAFIDNIPYVAAMLPVTASISLALSINPYLLYFGLICGATLGGNLTPIGASANITALGILQKNGYKTPLKQFIKISIPFTLIAVSSGYILIWLLWS